MAEATDSALGKKASESGVSIETLRKVYRRGVAAWRTGHRPGTTPQQWGMARVNSYITKGKTYHTADKDLREAEERDINFTPDKDVFHGLDKAVTDEVGFDGKAAGFVSFKSFMDEPEFVKTQQQHDDTRQSIHTAQVKDFSKHGPSYRAQVKKHSME